MNRTLKYIQVEYQHPISILCGSTNAIIISNNPIMNSKTKNTPLNYHFLCEKVANHAIKLDYVATKDQVENIFTKPLPRDTFEYLTKKLKFIPIHN